MADARAVLGESVARLRGLVDDVDAERPSYCDDWSIAQVLSHLGSGATINRGRLDELDGGPAVDNEAIWDEWNAKSPDAMVRDGLAADQALLDRLDALSDDQRASLELDFGPMKIGYDQLLAFRVNEHAVHTWDVEVAGDPTATLADGTAEIIVEAVPMMAGFAGKPTGVTKDLVVATTDPGRRFDVRLTDDGVSIARTDGDGPADLTLPTEAFIRLVYGRLDPDHTPAFDGDAADLDLLRRAFPGL